MCLIEHMNLYLSHRYNNYNTTSNLRYAVEYLKIGEKIKATLDAGIDTVSPRCGFKAYFMVDTFSIFKIDTVHLAIRNALNYFIYL